ncbi:hypothetical protein DPEC_G00049900 [Dallia pectoralis]|uniref:Uncharacterized protein n=1 Tax=Dallia pectoralis TaxID=75939 RepID=A0ACC2HB31_DALPE|nr:hypothetical protein DPEC_G00049900 [Dallia pectoralis]
MSVASASKLIFTRSQNLLIRYQRKSAFTFQAPSRIYIFPYLPHGSGGNTALLSTHAQRRRSQEKVTINFINRDGKKITASGSMGDSLLDLVVNQNLDIDGFGACEGTLACSTCHVILDQKVYDQLGPITDEENDLLDLAYSLSDTSRLGCQVCLSRDLEGVSFRVPDEMNDMRCSDDTGPKL